MEKWLIEDIATHQCLCKTDDDEHYLSKNFLGSQVLKFSSRLEAGLYLMNVFIRTLDINSPYVDREFRIYEHLYD